MREATSMRSLHTAARAWPPPVLTRESPHAAVKTQLSQKEINELHYIKRKMKKQKLPQWRIYLNKLWFIHGLEDYVAIKNK